MTEAEIEEESTADSELSVPKHRFDELSARLKRAEEEVQIKDQLIQNVVTQREPRDDDKFNPESLGIDAEIFKAAKEIAAREVAKVEKKYAGHIGQLANSLEETRFMQQYPSASNLLEEVKDYRNKQYKVTGLFLDLASSYKGLVFDRQATGTKKKVFLKKKEEVEEEEEEQEVPDKAATAAKGSSSTAVSKKFGELSLEEMEANIETQLGAGNLI